MRLGSMTDRGINALKHTDKRYNAWEPGRTGLGIRLAAAPSTRKTWQFQFWWVRPDGKRTKRRLKLGEYPVVGVAKARERWRAAKALLDEGKDPFNASAVASEKRRTAPTVTMLIKDFLAHQEALGRRTVGEYRRILEKDVEPAWGPQKAEDTTRQQVMDLIDGIAERGAPIVSNRTAAIVRRMFNYALRRGKVSVNPATHHEPKGKETARQRILSPAEIKAVWEGHPKTEMTDLTRLALRFALVTAQRRVEVATARYVDIDADAKTWLIPAERSKNGKPHLVPLSPLAMKLYREIKKLSGDEDWLFPSPQERLGHIHPHTLTRALGRERRLLKIDGVTVHDLRRTASTGMAALGVQRHVRDRVLNHVPGKLTSTYDVYEYQAEKRDALDKWGQRLKTIVAAKKGGDK